MNKIVENKSNHFLGLLYKKLKDNILRNNNKLVNDSILFTIMKFKSNKRYELLLESSMPISSITSSEYKILEAKNYITQTDEDIHQVILTGVGLWTYELELQKIKDNDLIEFIHNTYFTFNTTSKSLSAKEKVILITLIAIRCLSKKSSANLKVSDYILDQWRQVITDVYAFLFQYNIINDLKEEDLFGKPGNEHAVSHLIRHTDALPKKTKNIYKAAGNQKYYLDIFSRDLDKSKLKYLFDIILAENKSPELYSVITDFCRNLAYDKSQYFFDNLDEHLFNTSTVDDIFEAAIRESIFS